MAEESYKKNYFTPRNLLIYLVVALVVYGAVYFLFLSKKDNSPYSAPTPTTTTDTNQDQAEDTMDSEAMTMSVTLAAQNGSGQSGTATLTEENGKTKVVVNVAGAPKDVPQPAHIHSGACPTPGAIVYPLTDLVNGVSETVLDADLATIKSGLPLALNVHKSTPDVKTYVSCGDLK